MTVQDNINHQDSGCEVSPSCLSCPLPKCKYDDPVWYQQYQQAQVDLRVMETIRAEGLTVKQAAARFSVTSRTIFRIMSRCQEAET